MSEQSVDERQALWEKVRRVRFGMLTTWDGRLGIMRSRPMTNQQVEFDGTLWFFAADDGSVADEIAQQPQVNVSYAEPEDDLFVSVSGSAAIVRDREKIEQLWNPTYKAWFPKGQDDPHLVLIRIDVHAGEYWDVTAGKLGQLFAMTKAVLTGKSAYDIGDHGRIGNA